MALSKCIQLVLAVILWCHVEIGASQCDGKSIYKCESAGFEGQLNT